MTISGFPISSHNLTFLFFESYARLTSYPRFSKKLAVFSNASSMFSTERSINGPTTKYASTFSFIFNNLYTDSAGHSAAEIVKKATLIFLPVLYFCCTWRIPHLIAISYICLYSSFPPSNTVCKSQIAFKYLNVYLSEVSPKLLKSPLSIPSKRSCINCTSSCISCFLSMFLSRLIFLSYICSIFINSTNNRVAFSAPRKLK